MGKAQKMELVKTRSRFMSVYSPLSNVPRLGFLILNHNFFSPQEWALSISILVNSRDKPVSWCHD